VTLLKKYALYGAAVVVSFVLALVLLVSSAPRTAHAESDSGSVVQLSGVVTPLPSAVLTSGLNPASVDTAIMASSADHQFVKFGPTAAFSNASSSTGKLDTATVTTLPAAAVAANNTAGTYLGTKRAPSSSHGDWLGLGNGNPTAMFWDPVGVSAFSAQVSPSLTTSLTATSTGSATTFSGIDISTAKLGAAGRSSPDAIGSPQQFFGNAPTAALLVIVALLVPITLSMRMQLRDSGPGLHRGLFGFRSKGSVPKTPLMALGAGSGRSR